MSELPINAVLADRIRAAREALGVSQSELGRRMDLPDEVASSRVNRYEKGRHTPDIETAERLAKALGLPLPALLSRDDDLAELIAGFVLLPPKERAALLKSLRGVLGGKLVSDVRARLGQLS